MTNVEIYNYSIFRVTIKNIYAMHYPFRIIPPDYCPSIAANLQKYIPVKRKKEKNRKIKPTILNSHK